VPAAAVIPERQALFGIVGCKGYVGGVKGVPNRSIKGGMYSLQIKTLELV